MRLHGPLDDICNSRLKVRLLRILCRLGGEHSGRKLAGLAGFSHTQTITTLLDLESQGLVRRRRAGNAYMFTINRDNAIVSGVLSPAFEFESGLIESLADMFYDGLGRQLTSVILFGSVARGEETDESDVDLLLVLKDSTDRKLAENKVGDISHEVYLAFGCSAMPIVVSETEYQRKLKRKQGFWKEIPKEGRQIPRKLEREMSD